MQSTNKFPDSALPALFHAADKASITAQRVYYMNLGIYLLFLISAASSSYIFPSESVHGSVFSAILFLTTLGILIWTQIQKPEDIWYNGRAVAESVKTLTWRWMMKADPYNQIISEDSIQKVFLRDLKVILDQNRALSNHLHFEGYSNQAISEPMNSIRQLPYYDRLALYKKERVQKQLQWYAQKSKFNKQRATIWFTVSVILHFIAITLLLYRITNTSIHLPIETVATTASAVLTWTKAKNHNELNSSYSLAAQEIILIQSEAELVKTEKGLSRFVINSESAFSREHTQWYARKS